ncbi:non-ribosomal peptide synthetase, partial [Kitasatospora sp. MAP5-34]|uniref:non-ribosomal peptide synthetase n=1 Tax=Kitasatospora sp. MAP5-34 TaxID=3035102 RepID=UPI00247715CD
SAEDRNTLPTNIHDAYPLSQIQTGMLVEMLASSGRRSYHNINSFRIPDSKPFSADALRDAIRVVVGRHDILRTSMHLTGYGQPLQLVHSAVELPLTVHDLRGLDAGQVELATAEFADQQRADVFVPAVAPLVRANVHLESDDAWRLTFTQSHAITEGWSYNSMLMEILEAYRALRDGEELPAYEAPAARYADFIAAELASLESEEDRAYWLGVTDHHTPLTVPGTWGDRENPAERYRLPVPFTDLADDLRALAAQAGASLKTVLLAAHLKVMSALTTEDAFQTGLICHGRLEAPGAEKVLGMHLNTVPVPAVAGSAPTWVQLVEQTYAREIEIWGHRRYPLPAIQRDATSSQRLVSIMFEFIDFHHVDTEKIDARATLIEGTTEFELHVSGTAEAVNIIGATDTVSHANAELLAGMYRYVLEAMAADPQGDATGGALPPQTAERLIQAWNPAIGEPENVCVHEAFEARAAETPDAVAVVCEDSELTYRQVNERANRIAHHLISLGARPDSLVGVCLERGPELVPALLGVLKAGAAYLPLDPANPADRLGYILEDAAAELVITQSDLDSIPAGFPGTAILIDAHGDVIGGRPATNPGLGVTPDHLVYAIYTSGSTGRPKGVMLPHGALSNLVGSFAHLTGTWLATTSVSFDISNLELHLPLTTGGRVILAIREQIADPVALDHLVTTHRISHVQATPSGWRLLLAGGYHHPETTALVGGEELPASLAAELRPHTAQLLNVYGPTEATVWASSWSVPADPSPVLLGDPLANYSLHVLDRTGRPTPPGVPGELHIGGAGLARGYLGRPELTAERFIPDPYGTAGTRLYRTGDLARRNPDGSLEYLGRIDTQVKIRGYRIELGEIQAQLRGIPGLRDAVVIAREDIPGDKTLAAYLVVEDGVTVDPIALHAQLATTLPDYMVPSAFVVIDRIPLSISGKLDTRALPAPDRDAFSAGERVAPSTPAEQAMATAWADILGLDYERISVTDSFFDLGGDSIRAVRLAGALSEHGYQLEIRDIFVHRTIANLAANAVTGDDVRRFAAVEPFALIGEADRAALPEDVVDAYPLSQVQTGMLVEMLASGERGTYVNINSFRVPDGREFSLDALEAALRIVVQRHDILRTSMHLDGYGQPLQLVHASVELPVAVHDLRHLDPTQQREAEYAWAREERAGLLDMSIAPTLRVNVHLESDAAWRLTLTQSHAITEGWSLNALTMELLDVYRAIRDGHEQPAFEELTVRYADFIAAELSSLDSAEDQAFWKDITDQHAPLTLPDAWGSTSGQAEPLHAQAEFADLADRLRALATTAGASLKTVLLAAHLKVMSALTTETAFHTGLVTHGRLEAPGAERVLGMHLNTLPIAFRTGHSRTWLDLVRDTYTTETGIWGHRRHPLPAIQRTAGADRLITVLFDYLDFHHVDTDKIDTTGTIGGAVNEFALNTIAQNGHIHLTATTRTLTPENAAQLAAMYRTVLEAMATDPHGDATTSPLPAGEQAHLLATGTATQQPVPALAIDQFETQATTTPDATAIIFGEQTTTYRQLDDRANQIAHQLKTLGVTGPVGIHLERSTDLIAALLATWKSGAPYLPLDPKLPAERLTHILTDTNAKIVLTTTELAPTLPDTGAHLVLLDRMSTQPVTAPARAIHPLDTAYIIYTSGSTGTPKGVMAHHQGLANYLAFTTTTYATTPGGAPLFSPITFDLGIPNIFTPLVTGQPVHLLPHNLDTADLGATLAAGAPYSFIKLTPAHLELLTHQLTTDQAANLAGQIIAAGDTFTTDLANRWYQLTGHTG